MEVIGIGSPSIVTKSAESYSSKVPNLFNFVSSSSDLRHWILSRLTRGDVLCPAEGIEPFTNCKILDGKYLFNTEDVLIGETAHDSNVSEIEQRVKQCKSSRMHYSSDLTKNNWPFAHIFKAGASNYGHFLVEIAPKLIGFAKHYPDGVNIIVPKEGAWSLPFIKLICDALGFPAHPVLVPEGFVTFDHLLYHTPVSKHNKRKSNSLLELKNILLENLNCFEGEEKFVVWRKSNAKRRVNNEEDLLSMLKERGFKIIYPEEYSFVEQIKLFSSASAVIGPLGAGLTNTLFCSEGSDIFMIDPGLYDFFFWDMACLNKHEFSWYFTKPIEMFAHERLEQPYQVDTDSISQALDQISL